MKKVRRGYNPPPKEDCPTPPPFPSSGSSACCGADATHSGLVSPRCGDGLLDAAIAGLKDVAEFSRSGEKWHLDRGNTERATGWFMYNMGVRRAIILLEELKANQKPSE